MGRGEKIVAWFLKCDAFTIKAPSIFLSKALTWD